MRRFVFAALLVASPALAQEEAEPEAGRSARYRAVTEIDFGVLDVDGQLVKPEVVLTKDRPAATFNPMVKLRHDFAPEMRASIDQIR